MKEWGCVGWTPRPMRCTLPCFGRYPPACNSALTGFPCRSSFHESYCFCSYHHQDRHGLGDRHHARRPVGQDVAPQGATRHPPHVLRRIAEEGIRGWGLVERFAVYRGGLLGVGGDWAVEPLHHPTRNPRALFGASRGFFTGVHSHISNSVSLLRQLDQASINSI